MIIKIIATGVMQSLHHPKNSCIIEYIHDTCRSKYTYFKYTLYYVWNYSFLLVEIDVECIDFEFPLVKIPDMSLFGKCM